ncbi:MAG: TraI domain-containing protein [Hydrogenovibrio sp.]|uniref:TraI domain-containing protein n=1 Tax=Hydrogenovibrio sp. TaxID=2065821 RepID=UPI00286FE25B|nr:TraI domain-containing protein [Hydrogenovibrio sp.]MDR9500060.1 TraI domain-containing protein [Hydrogenovibrio sp.]
MSLTDQDLMTYLDEAADSTDLEIAIEPKGKQIMGYLGVIQSTLGYPTEPCHYVAIDTLDGQSVALSLPLEDFQSVVDVRDQTSLTVEEYLFFWAEVDETQEVVQWRLFKLPMTLNAFQPIYNRCHDFPTLYRLIQLGHYLTVPALRSFFWQVFTDVPLMEAFVSIPASKNHHHSFPSGLLIHSMECAYFVQRQLSSISEISQREGEVTLLAALWHDIGKTETLGQVTHTDVGRLIDHEALTLMVLSEPLAQLKRAWTQGAITLQYLLTWKSNQGFCQYVGGNLIKMADQFSTSLSLQRMAFEDKPDFYHYASVEAGSGRWFVNRIN